MKNQVDITKMLRDAWRSLDIRWIEAQLPEPFKVWMSNHDTGCQVTIMAEAEGYPRIAAWTGSIWYSSCYDFNDRGKTLGLNPEFEFAAPVIFGFFETVQQALIEHQTKQALQDAERTGAEEVQRRNALDFYKRKSNAVPHKQEGQK